MSSVRLFWRRVRELRREIAVQLYMQDHKHLGVFNTPEEAELKEAGYWDKARVLASRKIRLEEFGLKTLREIFEELNMMFRKEHIEKIVRGHKTQTRRLSRLRTRLYEVGRAYRIRRDWYHFTDIWILVTKRYRQRLGDITPEEINKEGYETLEEFQRAWIEINGAWDRDKVVWVYEFKVLNSSEDRMERR